MSERQVKPGQLTANDFERAILLHMSRKVPALAPMIDELHVLSRKYTGVGSFTEFHCVGAASDGDHEPITLDCGISMPGLANGMGALLFWCGGRPKCLETYTFDEHWDGAFDGFSIV
jgi:hypothetical protein